MWAPDDTIAAIATALGEASVGIVRVSGRSAAAVARQVFRRPAGGPFACGAKRGVHYGFVVDPESGERIDEGLLLWMPGPRSYTAEDVAELQVHGGIRVVELTLDAVLRAGARLAEPGEFTKRAFLNGRIDLSQAEGVIDLIRAKTDLAVRSALNQVDGHFSGVVREMRQALLKLQAHIEVTIDYPEHDVEQVAVRQIVETGEALVQQLDRLLASAKFGQILREGVTAAIVGRPNVGKSSLLNRLLRRDRAIVTDIPGTTRDVIEEYANVQGVPFRLVDTAGIRETDDVVERIGVERSRQVLAEGGLILLVLNGSEPLSSSDLQLLAETEGRSRIVVVNKADLAAAVSDGELARLTGESRVVRVSALSGEGLAELEAAMVRSVAGGEIAAADAQFLTNARQTEQLRAAKADLEEAVAAAQAGATLDLVAVSLQSAYAALGSVIGEDVGEDLLDAIFSEFCLGK
ncbi:MAG: tRNA uridine-5-carboxymethylaminomethyl(34) synthesis GTPase MnmE [Alicyclobacillaceae bacterium]|nr:tRNA uridine-5-carboxymethylaminomethyl(34) synthesis GTPase MnmE [Alicyclobacillaceae bacterium]